MSVFQTLTLEQVGQSIANNTSKVRVKWTSQQTGSSYNDAPGDKAYYYITLNGGTRTEHTVAFTLPQNTTKTILDTTITVNHNPDGTGSVKVDTWMNTEISAGVIEQTKTLTLDTIPRASVVSAPKTGALGSALKVEIDRKSASFTDKLYYKVGSKSEEQITAYDGKTTTYNWKPPVSLATNAPNSTKLTVTLITKTYNGNTYVGRSECVVELSIPTSVAPTLSVALSDPTKVSTTYGGYVQLRSKITVELTAAGSYGSTIKSYSIKVGNFYAATTSSGTTDYLPSSGNVDVVCSVTDSRGRTTTKKQPVTVLPYSKPTISAISAARCNQNGSANRAGAYGKVTFSAAITKLSGKNTAAYKVQYRAHGAATWTDAGSVANGNYSPANVYVVFAADTNTRYAVRVVATDKFESVESTIRDLPAAFILMDLAKSKKSVGVGRECDKDNTFQVGLYAHFEKPVNQEVSGNPWYGLNDGTNQWHLQAFQDSNKLALGLTWDSSLKIDTNGNVTLPENLTGKYLTGTWLQATAATDLGKAPPYVCVFDANGWLYKRKLSELFSDMGIPAQKDYVVERGTSSSWHYEKWNSGKLELWRQTTSSNLGTTGQINGWYYRAYTVALPPNLLKNIQDVQCNCVWGTGVSFASGSADAANFKAIYFSNQNGGAGTFWHRITGTWK